MIKKPQKIKTDAISVRETTHLQHYREVKRKPYLSTVTNSYAKDEHIHESSFHTPLSTFFPE